MNKIAGMHAHALRFYRLTRSEGSGFRVGDVWSLQEQKCLALRFTGLGPPITSIAEPGGVGPTRLTSMLASRSNNAQTELYLNYIAL